MSNMPGNPHASRAIQTRDNAYQPNQSMEKQAVSARIAQAEASLAVAFELRTQTIVSLHRMNVTQLADTPYDEVPEEVHQAMRERAEEISDRLGATK